MCSNQFLCGCGCGCHGSFFIFCDRKHRAGLLLPLLLLLLLFHFIFFMCFVFRTILLLSLSISILSFGGYFVKFFSVVDCAEDAFQARYARCFSEMKMTHTHRVKEKHKTINTRKKPRLHFTKVNLNAYNTCIEMVGEPEYASECFVCVCVCLLCTVMNEESEKSIFVIFKQAKKPYKVLH